MRGFVIAYFDLYSHRYSSCAEHCKGLREDMLIPHQGKEYRRKKALVDFFRKEVFRFPEVQAIARLQFKSGITCRSITLNPKMTRRLLWS